MAGSSVDLRAEVERRRGLARPLADGGPWVHWRDEANDEAAAGGRPEGPLESVLVAIKDLVAVEGLPVGAGNRRRSAGPPSEHDAAIVERLRGLGAVILGTVAMHELAFGTTGINDQVGFPSNPAGRPSSPTGADVDSPSTRRVGRPTPGLTGEPGSTSEGGRGGGGRIPGGSSSGSAVAVADGSCDLAVGSDTGGSVRIPAALCGVVGFKPGRGTYPLDGVLALAPSLDHLGLLARTVEEIAVAHRALTGGGVSGPPQRLGVDRAALEAASPEVASAIDELLRRLRRVELVEVVWPNVDRVRELTTTIMFSEAAEVHRELLAEVAAGGTGLVGEDVLARLQAGAGIAEADRLAALAEAKTLTAEVAATLATIDAVVGPTVAFTTPTVDEARHDPDLPGRLVTHTRLGNLTGLPALTVPVPIGLDAIDGRPAPGRHDRQRAPGATEATEATEATGARSDRLPVGLQVMGATEGQVLGVGLAVQGLPAW